MKRKFCMSWTYVYNKISWDLNSTDTWIHHICSGNNRQYGQSLITLLFFVAIGITVITAAAFIVASDFSSITNTQSGIDAYYNAEGGLEDGILYVLRYHPTSSSITVNASNPTITVTYNSAQQMNTITSIGTDGTTTRTMSANATFSGGKFNISNWKEQ